MARTGRRRVADAPVTQRGEGVQRHRPGGEHRAAGITAAHVDRQRRPHHRDDRHRPPPPHRRRAAGDHHHRVRQRVERPVIGIGLHADGRGDDRTRQQAGPHDVPHRPEAPDTSAQAHDVTIDGRREVSSVHKTTINLRADVWLRLRNRAERDGVSVASLVNELLADALTSGDGGAGPSSIAAGEADVADLGANAKKYLRASMR